MFKYVEIPQNPWDEGDDPRPTGFVRRVGRSVATNMTGFCGVCERRFSMEWEGFACGACRMIVHRRRCSEEFPPNLAVENPDQPDEESWVYCNLCKVWD